MSHDYSDKLLVTDMDGTLIDKNGNISEKNVLEDPSTVVHLQDFC